MIKCSCATAISLLLIATGCAYTGPRSRVNRYTAFGMAALGEQERVARDYETALKTPTPHVPVQILNATLPPGVEVKDGQIKVADGAPFQVIGEFEIGYWRSLQPNESEIVDDVKRMAKIVGADIVVVQVQKVSHGNPKVEFFTGIALKNLAAPTPRTTDQSL